MPFDTSQSNPAGANYRETFANLCGRLPPSPPGTSADARAAHEKRLMEAVAALHPMDWFEADLAVRIVAMGAHADDSLRLAGLAANDPAEMHRCRAQAVSMARQADSALRTLRRMQADRDKALAAMHPAAMERAGYWWSGTAGNCTLDQGVSRPSPTVPQIAPHFGVPYARTTTHGERTRAGISMCHISLETGGCPFLLQGRTGSVMQTFVAQLIGAPDCAVDSLLGRLERDQGGWLTDFQVRTFVAFLLAALKLPADAVDMEIMPVWLIQTTPSGTWRGAALASPDVPPSPALVGHI